MIKTSCENCVFRINENDIQIDCKLDRLQKFKNRGKADLQDSGYYIIDRFCNTCRDSSSFISMDQLNQEISISCTFILNGNLDNLWRLLKDVSNLEFMPQRTVVFLSRSFDRDRYLDFQNIFNSKSKQLIFKRYIEDISIESALDEICHRTDTQYYSYITDLIDGNPLEELNSLLNNDLERVVAIIKDKNSIVSTILHKRLGGNTDKCILEKIKELKETLSEEESSMIWIR